ncbi:MAG: hypothetical protein GF417_14255, partial [Candidatus Latescibacteria bacterium]|nr:hypothetical protein [bacterium]MBD3425594.1 hypothetical protein [Candidatus Latescibacterota bacterium]
MYKFSGRIPAKTIIYIITAWMVMAGLNAWLKSSGLYCDVPYWFPISIFAGPTVHLSGIPFLIIFILVLFLAIRMAPGLSHYQIWLIGLSLIILGNLGQGGWHSSFIKPFSESGMQYYHDAIRISSWTEWLEYFNTNQQDLLCHTRTHPPFAVLIHYLFLRISNGNLNLLSMAFVFLSSISILLVWKIFRTLGLPAERRNLLAIIFSVLPAVNIYCGVSLEGLILTGSLLFLSGVVMTLHSGRRTAAGLLSISLGMVITSMLSYAGCFLLAVGGLLSFREISAKREYNFTAAFLISISVFAAITAAIHLIYGFNYIQGFIISVRLENPDGFSLVNDPLLYLVTRIESASEVALFLSLGLLATLF